MGLGQEPEWAGPEVFQLEIRDKALGCVCDQGVGLKPIAWSTHKSGCCLAWGRGPTSEDDTWRPPPGQAVADMPLTSSMLSAREHVGPSGRLAPGQASLPVFTVTEDVRFSSRKQECSCQGDVYVTKVRRRSLEALIKEAQAAHWQAA